MEVTIVWAQVRQGVDFVLVLLDAGIRHTMMQQGMAPDGLIPCDVVLPVA